MIDATGRRNSSDVAREADDVRANLAHTLAQLRENLKPENVVEEVMTNARIGVDGLADGLYAIARKNPLPALLIGAGCAMVMGLGSRFGTRRKPFIDLAPSDNAVRVALGDGRASPALPRPSTGLWSPYRKVDAWPGENLSASGPLTNSQDIMDRSTGAFTRSAAKSPSRLADMLREQPLIIAALGVAVGAAIGAALPGTDAEDDWMGGTSASVKRAATDAARSEIDELRAVAGRAADHVKHSAADHGLSADNLSDFVQDVGDHAKNAIHDVGAKATSGQPA